MSIPQAIARAWSDDGFKVKLVNCPKEALAETVVKVGAGTAVKVVEDTADTRYIVLPVA